MASVSTPRTGTVPSIIRSKLRSLRLQLTSWMIVDGLVWLLIGALILAAADMFIDRIFKMDLPQRVIMLCLMAGTLLVIACLKIFRPLMFRPSDDALILEVEDKNKDLKESLISSVQLSRTKEIESKGMSATLVDATINLGVEKAKALNFSSALDRVRGGINWFLLIVGVVGILALAVGVANGGFFGTWFNRNILLGDEQWPQSTYLNIVPEPVNGQIVVARGDDFKLYVVVDPKSRVKDVDVSLEVRDGTNRSKQKMKKTGRQDGTEHITVFRMVSSEFEFRAIGGDDVTAWVKVKLVEAPSLTNLKLTATLPKYIGPDNKVPLEGSGPHSVLKGSTLDFVATVNKPLQTAQLKLGEDIFDLQKSSDQLVYTLSLPHDGELAGGKYEFNLVDMAGQKSIRPISFTVKIRDDQPPIVRANLQGISGLIVPKAVLPISYSATDQFGLTKTAFFYSWKGGESSVLTEKTLQIPLKFEKDEDGVVTDDRTVRQRERLDLRPEKIPVGVTLRVLLHAWDNQPGSPEPGKSREFLLRVVTEDELRADLLRREVEQRNAFEQAYNNQLELQTELKAIAAALPTKAEDPSKQQAIIDQFFAERIGKILALQRRQKIIGTNIAAVADRFESFMIEAENNRLDESESKIEGAKTIKARLSNEIINPIRALDEREVFDATLGIDSCRRVARKQSDFAATVEKTTELQETILAKMRLILEAMNNAETYQEIVNRVIEIKRKETEIANNVEKEKEKPGEIDIFDTDDDKKKKKSDKNKKPGK